VLVVFARMTAVYLGIINLGLVRSMPLECRYDALWKAAGMLFCGHDVKDWKGH
jgi:hypothetical protein